MYPAYICRCVYKHIYYVSIQHYRPTKMYSVYSTVPADWARLFNGWWGSSCGVVAKVLDCDLEVVIYEALCFDVAQGQMNGAPNETRSKRVRSLVTQLR